MDLVPLACEVVAYQAVNHCLWTNINTHFFLHIQSTTTPMVNKMTAAPPIEPSIIGGLVTGGGATRTKKKYVSYPSGVYRIINKEQHLK